MTEDTHRDIVLVGGPNDGERYSIGKRLKSFRLHAPKTDAIEMYYSDCIAVAGDWNTMTVFVHSSISEPQVWIQMLIDGYRREAQDGSSRT